MATPMEQIVMVEKALKMLTTVVQDNAPRHGLGNAQSEADRCEQVHVFLRCIGKSSSLAENQRLLLPKHSTVVDRASQWRPNAARPCGKSQCAMRMVFASRRVCSTSRYGSFQTAAG